MKEKDARQPSGTRTDPSPPLLIRQPTTPITVGQVIAGRYELRAQLGAGAMGAVFRAYDRDLKEEIALKTLLSWRRGESQSVARLRSEVTLARRITHRNVCRVFDLGKDGDFQFLTMELVEGQPLRALLARDRMEPEQAFSILDQIAAGLGAAHAQGVLHRDLKPENVMVCRDGRVVLVDFGLARSLACELTASCVGAGTPAYMSPEQVRGESLDARSDIFSLGILAFELLSGEGPFGALPREEISRAILHAPPQPLVVRGLPSNVVSALGEVLDRAMAKQPDERFRTAGELGAALAAARRGVVLQDVCAPGERPSVRGYATAARGRISRRGSFEALSILAILLILGSTIPFVTGARLPWIAGDVPDDEQSSAKASALQARSAAPPLPAVQDERPAMVVLPFENQTGDPQWNGLAQAATTAVQSELTRDPAIRVIDVPAANAQESAVISEAVWRLDGAVRLSGARIHIEARIRTKDGSTAGEAIDIETEENRARELIDRLRVSALDEVRLLQRAFERRRQAERGTSNEVARAALLSYYDIIGPGPRGEVLEAGKRLVAKAISEDPRYVPALLEQAELLTFEALANARNEKLARALAAVRRALEIEPQNPRALMLLCRETQRNLIFNGYPDDAAVATSFDVCNTALTAQPRSAEILRIMARLSDFTCQDNLAMLQLERALELDRSLSGPILGHLIALALQNGRTHLADEMSKRLVDFSDEEAKFGTRALSRRAGTPAAEGAHSARANVLIRLGRLDEAHAHLEKELRYIAVGMGNTWVEPAAIRGLLQIAKQQGHAAPMALRRRLAVIESEYHAAITRDSSIAWILVGAYQFVDPRASLMWLQRLGRPSNFRNVIAHALLHHLAGDDLSARRALNTYHPTHRWERQCDEQIRSEFSR